MEKIIISNFKMNKNLQQIQDYIKLVEKDYDLYKNVIFCPSPIYLPLFDSQKFLLGAQDVTAFENLQLTGEIGAKQLFDLGCKYTLIAHPERRIFLQEENEVIFYKIKNALANSLIPVVCIGELKEKQNSFKYLKKQINSLIKKLNKSEIKKIIFAYEPNYMIDSNKPIDYQKLTNIVDFIKKIIFDETNEKINVIYGGNVNPENIENLEKIKNLDGYLIGRNCLNLETLKQILEKI